MFGCLGFLCDFDILGKVWKTTEASPEAWKSLVFIRKSYPFMALSLVKYSNLPRIYPLVSSIMASWNPELTGG